MDWFSRLSALSESVSATLKTREWAVTFGGVDEREGSIKTPQPARSAFLQNRAMGDWAEDLLATALHDIGFGVAHYGASDDIDSADPAFPAFYKTQTLNVRREGKRPDLLLTSVSGLIPPRVGTLPAADRDRFVEKASASIEVRSSKLKALKYLQVKAERKANKVKAVGQLAPNFTVKVEDLVILYRWVERFKVPQAYVQVFLDSAYAINVVRIFELIADWPPGLTLVKPERSQDKPTIFIPITLGTQIGQMTVGPEFTARTRESPLGQVEAYVVPSGGKLVLDRNALSLVLDR